MDINILEDYLVGQLFAILLVFTRLGTALMFLPAFGESYVNTRARLLLALTLSFAMAPFVERFLPEVPGDPARLAFLLMGEIFIGALIGFVGRFLVSAMHIAGMVISFQSSLQLATQFDNTQTSQSSMIGNLLSISAVVFILALDLHHMMLRGIIDSYTLMSPAVFPPVEDIADYMARLLSITYRVGVQFAAPSMVGALLLYLLAGVLSRLMPNMQVFFVILPLQLMIAFFLLMAAFSSILTEFARFFTTMFSDFLEGI